jgi:hypothetical protein
MSKPHTYKYIWGISGITALIIPIIIGMLLWLSSSLSAQNYKAAQQANHSLPSDTTPPYVDPTYIQAPEDPRVKFTREHCTFDLNGDGKCDMQDTRLLSQMIGACKGDPNYNELADVDHDGCVTERDQEQLFPMFIRDNSRQPCDLNGDGVCDWEDYKIFLKSVHMCFDNEPTVLPYECHSVCAYNPLADANRDGCVLGDDMRLLFPIIPERKSK